MPATRTCACGCRRALPANSTIRRKYLNDQHRDRVKKRRQRARQLAADKDRRIDAKPFEDQSVSYIGRDTSKDGRASARRGRGYEEFVESGWPVELQAGRTTTGEAAAALDTSPANVSRWMAAFIEDQANEVARESWVRDDEVEEALLSLRPFMARFHSDLLYAPYYDEWEAEVDGVIGTGGRLCLLAPQRHSKTEFLIRYCQRRIAADPDICILWVGRSKELAEESVGMLRQLLEQEDFCESVLGPGEKFQPPPRSGKSWTDEKFTVAQRTKVRKSPTVRALGIGGTTSGRDADLIVVDDPQEREDCISPTTREKQARWFLTTLLARKMEHTGIALITSRRHLDDIPGRLVRDHADDWRMVTYRAHAIDCPKPEDDPDAHTDCVLWPELRSFRFLMGQKRADVAFFECNYQNNPTADSLVLIKAEDLERCKDYDRRIGALPKGATQLIVGIDPAEAKPVAAVLWAWQPEGGRMHIVDTMEADPGIRGGRQIVEGWHQKYGVTDFVVEKNIAQSWWQDKELRDYRARNGIPEVRQHYTSATNKMDPSHGVPKMFNDMRTQPPKITFPYADRETREKMDRFLQTILLFDPDNAGNKHADDDLPMAAWFAHHVMQGWSRTASSTAVADYPQTAWNPMWRTAYPRIDRGEVDYEELAYA